MNKLGQAIVALQLMATGSAILLLSQQSHATSSMPSEDTVLKTSPSASEPRDRDTTGPDKNTSDKASAEIPYTNMAAAIADLSKRPGVRVGVSDGWTVIQYPKEKDAEIWVFSPPTDPVHPAMVKRVFSVDGDQRCEVLTIRCDGAANACEELERGVRELYQSELKQDH